MKILIKGGRLIDPASGLDRIGVSPAMSMKACWKAN